MSTRQKTYINSEGNDRQTLRHAQRKKACDVLRAEDQVKVSELISFLQTQPQDIEVAYDLYSEHCILEQTDIRIMTACAARPDGWVQDKRSDKPSQTYLMLPGN